MSAMTNLQAQANGAVAVQTPLLSKKRVAKKQKTAESEESISAIIAKLASLRERYLPEMQAARDRVKKNFLR